MGVLQESIFQITKVAAIQPDIHPNGFETGLNQDPSLYTGRILKNRRILRAWLITRFIEEIINAHDHPDAAFRFGNGQ